MRTLLALAAVAASALPLSPAAAQVAETIRIRVGLGAQTTPSFIGADSNDWGIYPNFGFARGDKPFGIGAPDDNFSPKLIGSGGFSAGPAAAIEGSRRESEVGASVGKVPTTFELGAFAQQDFGPLRLHAQARKGIGGHDGLVGHLAADLVVHEGDRYAFTVGPRLLFSNARYQRAYFGVSPEVSIAALLPQYRPDAGLHAIAATAGGRYSLGGPWGLFGYARYERLVGDAKNSPIVERFGSADQYSAGLGISHSFTLRL